MKKVAVIVLFLCFSARPVYEISYIAYFQLNIDYIVEKYCINKDQPKLECNGKCHLEDQLSLVGNGSKEQKDQNVTLIESFLPLYFQSYTYKFEIFSPKNVNEQNWGIPENWKSIFYAVPSPPPKV